MTSTVHMAFHDQPCAQAPWTSYRLRGPFGCIMIGAMNADEALEEAERSTATPFREYLEVWSDEQRAYVPA